MGWVDTVTKFFRRQTTGQVSELARGASGEATMPRTVPSSLYGDSGMGGAYQQLTTMLAVDSDLLLRYADYENMDDTEILSAALDIYADSATVEDSVHGQVIWGLSKDKIIRDIINDLLTRRVRIEEDLWTAIRTLCKYGNIYGEIVTNEHGVLGLNWLPPPTVRRIVDERGILIGFVQDPTGAFSYQINTMMDLDRLRTQDGSIGMVFFHPWEVAHWRFRGKQMRGLYGHSLLDSIRWVWKRLVMLEDNSLAMKLLKAPARFAFYIDTGEVPPREAKALVDEVRRRYKKRKIVDPSTGRLDFRMNPMEMTEDFFIPTRGGKESTRIEVLSGPDYDETGVLGYFQKKLYAGLRIPPQYLGGTEITNRASLCLAGDTPIPLLDGTAPTIAELAQRSEPFWVYSIDREGNVVPGHAHSSRVTRRMAETVEVVLDNGEVLTCTPDHPVMMRDGTYERADRLVPGSSVMPLYRKISGDGCHLRGYEMVYNPCTSLWRYTHRIAVGPVHRGMVRHHANFDKRDNRPCNLVAMGTQEHMQLHSDALERTLLRPDVRAKRKAAQARWAKSTEGRRVLAENIKHTKKPCSRFWDWVHSDRHRQLKSVQMCEQWQDPNGRMRTSRTPEWCAKMSGIMQGRIADGTAPDTRGEKNGNWRSDATMDHLVETVASYRCTGIKHLIRWSGYSELLIQRVLRQAGMTYREFKDQYMGDGSVCKVVSGDRNHQVVTVRRGPVIDTYDLTVDDYHNFAVGQGIFVHNSQEDVAFARLIGRIQREFLAGLSQVVRVHLAALNIDPDSVRWSLQMSVPSAIFEMQQVEVWNARAGLAAAIQPFFTNPWILANIFHMSDEDSLFASEAKMHEIEAQALSQAAVQSEIMRQFPELGPEGAMALGAPQQMGGMLPPGMDQGGAPVEAVQRRVDKALTEMQATQSRMLRSMQQTDVAVASIGKRLRIADQTRSGRG